MGRIAVMVSCLALAALAGATAFSLASRGHPVVLPLDDAYIYLQYARTGAAGEPGAYAPGEERTAGTTSPAWFVLTLAAAGIIDLLGPGVRDALPAGALVLCIAVTALALWLGYRAARDHGAGPLGAWAVPLVCLLAPLWFFGMMNGMETGLFAAGLLAALRTLAGGSPAWLLVPALARPEGALIAAAIVLIRLLRSRGEEPATRLPTGAWTVPLAAAGFTLLFPWILAGGPTSAWEAKALLAEPDPEVRGFYIPRIPYFLARTLWFGLSGGRTQPPLDVAADVLQRGAWLTWVWAVFLGGGALLALAGRRARMPALLWVIASALVLVPIAWDAQHYRYLVPAYALLAVTAAAGWFGGSRLRGVAGLLVLTVLTGGSLLGSPSLSRTVRWLYRGEAEQIAGAQVRVGDWLRENTPGEARVATHDVGAIAFRGERPVVDLVGLVTPGLAGAYRHGEGALWEALDRLPPGDRPTHAAVIPAWMPYLSRTLWAGERLWGLGSSRSRNPVSQEFEVWRLSWPDHDPEIWPGGDYGNRPRNHAPQGGGWRVVDALDLADLRSERDHGYAGPVAKPPTVVRNLGFLPLREPRPVAMEGGRDVTGDVAFRLRGVREDPAILAVRTASARNAILVVSIEGWSDTLAVPRGEDRFQEPAVFIPQGVLESTVDGVLEVRVAGAGYRAFHWWLLQPTEKPNP